MAPPEVVAHQTPARTYADVEMPGSSFIDRLTASRAQLVHKITAKDSTGRWACYFVLVMPEREARFMAALHSKEPVELETWGTVIASSYGTEPSSEVRAMLKERYWFDV